MANLVKRNKIYYLQWRVGGKARRRSLGTSSRQIAKEKLRQFESAQYRGESDPGPTRTRLESILQKYVEYVRTTKTPKSAQVDVYYLRQMFGPICPGLQYTGRRPTPRMQKRPRKVGQDRRFKLTAIEVDYLEQITTADVATFIASHVKSRGLAPKTANRYREIVNRLFNWAIQERGVKMPGGVNPVAKVGKYRQHAPNIRFLDLQQIEKQLEILEDHPLLLVLVATYIYAGLRREEALWLTCSDVDFDSGPHGILRIRAKTVGGESWQPKTKSNRAVPISSTLRWYLDRYTPKFTAGKWFFPSPKGLHYDPDNFSRNLRNVNKKVGLPWACLDFRHTFGSQLAITTAFR